MLDVFGCSRNRFREHATIARRLPKAAMGARRLPGRRDGCPEATWTPRWVPGGYLDAAMDARRLPEAAMGARRLPEAAMDARRLPEAAMDARRLPEAAR